MGIMGGGSVCRINSFQLSGRAVSLLRYLMLRTDDSRPFIYSWKISGAYAKKGLRQRNNSLQENKAVGRILPSECLGILLMVLTPCTLLCRVQCFKHLGTKWVFPLKGGSIPPEIRPEI